MESRTDVPGRTLLQLRSEETGQTLAVLSPPEVVEELPAQPVSLDRRALSPFGAWQLRHEIIQLGSVSEGLAAIHGGRVQLEPYQLVPVEKLLKGAHRNLLIADDVGLGKTIEAGLCIIELMARGVAQRVLLVVPPGLIDQWVDEMQRKFGLDFESLSDSASLDQAQTELADGLSPWSFHDRVITSTEFLKRPGIYNAALRRAWDVIVVDEAHYLAESGSPASPYSTKRTLLGLRLREQTRSLILLTATPHNGYRHSFRSLLELVEPTDASLAGNDAAVRRRVSRSMVRRLKQQITRAGPGGERVPAFVLRAPVRRLQVRCDLEEEREVFRLVTRYCTRTAAAAAGSDQQDLVSFAMQIVKKRMLSSRLALSRTISNRLDALRESPDEEGPTRAELRELQGDLPLPEQQADRLVSRVLRAAVPKDARQRNAEKRQLREIQRAIEALGDRPDPKISLLVSDLRRVMADNPAEKAIVFTEYRDTLEAVRDALNTDGVIAGRVAELAGGLTARQRRERIALFSSPQCRILLATDAASEGLNLQHHCRRLYHVELPWNPNRLEQRNGRIDRYGQHRQPEIAYLFYADSPEDRVLDRLVSRISQMQGDRVSTPDIIGIVEATRLPERLLDVKSDEDADRASENLVRVFDERHDAFLRDVAPLLAAEAESGTAWDDASADPILRDDIALEQAMLRLLGANARPSIREHEYRVTVPPALRGPGAQDAYPMLTFRRSVALADGSDATEFAHRLHPLVRAAVTTSREWLRFGSPGVTQPPSLAVRRLNGALQAPAAVFTYAANTTGVGQRLLAVAVDHAGTVLPDEVADRALSAAAQPGDVPWSECETVFAGVFVQAQEVARAAVVARLEGMAAAERERRARLAVDLRAEVEAYRGDRLNEIDREEADERAGTRDQAELFRETRTNWDARRAAIATQADARLAQLARWQDEPVAPVPDPLGVLLVFPGVDS